MLFFCFCRIVLVSNLFFFFSSRRRHTRSYGDWSSDVCSSDLGGLQPLAQAIMLECFPPEERGVAMAAYGMGIVVMPIVGPTLGGWITDNFSWRWIFYINLPIGIAGLLMQQAFVEDPPWIVRDVKASIDYIGFGLMAIGIGVLQLVLDKGQESDWFGATWI